MRRSQENAEEMGYDTREELREVMQDPFVAASPTECRALAILIAGDAAPSPIPKSWTPVARRLVYRGHLKITGTERVFRTTDAGRIERARLEAAGVLPAVALQHRYAHDGEKTTVCK
jgi:hypothetical protein